MTVTAWQRRAPDHEVTLGDSGVVVEDTLYSAGGTVVDLSGISGVEYQARIPGSATLDIDKAGSVIAPATNGQVRCVLTASETDVAGAYIERWRVTFGGGGVEYFPTDRHKLLVHDAT
jgi:hypothetical protein